jgi:hypothetical protein
MRLPDQTTVAIGTNAEFLIRAREAVKEYLAALPNFNADESSVLYTSPVVNPPSWQASETLQSEVSLEGTRGTHRGIVRNGKPWPETFEHLPPAPRASIELTLLRFVIDPNCASLEFQKRAVEGGTPVVVYTITSPQDSCRQGGWGAPGERFYPAHKGEIAFAESDALVRRLELASVGYPKEYLCQFTQAREIWDYIQIGERRFLLPTEAQSLQSQAQLTLSVTKYKNHRHFESFSNIQFTDK